MCPTTTYKALFYLILKKVGLKLTVNCIFVNLQNMSSLSRDPLGYVRLVINTTLGYGIIASGEIGTLWCIE